MTVKVLGQQRGPKIRIGKYKKRTGYKRHNGFRAALTQIEIESIGAQEACRRQAEGDAEPRESRSRPARAAAKPGRARRAGSEEES